MSYAPLAADSPTSMGHRSQQRMSMRILRRPVAMAAIIGILFLGIVWDYHRPSSTTHDLVESSGWLGAGYSQSSGSPSEHTEPISVILMAGKNDHQVLTSARSLLSTTVGPYELIGVFTEPTDQSQRIVDILVNHHRSARVDLLGKGMTRYTSLNVSKHDDFALHKAIDKARYGYIGIVNANTQLIEYGWDRILLTGLKSSDSLIAVSGKAAVNVRSSSSHVDFTDVVGQLHAIDHDVAASPPSIEVRNAAIRSPILYDVEQVLAAGGWMGRESEHAGMGDVEICLRAAEHEKQCGFYPISTNRLTSAREVWNPAPGELVLEEGSITDIPLSQLGLGGMSEVERLLRHAEPISDVVEALPRQMEDVPRTIVTAFSGNHQHTVQQWYNSLHLAPHTRFVAYILPSDQDVDPASFADWQNVEIRTFDFSHRPAWVDVTVNRGEYAWKPLIVEEIVRDYGGLVFWMDAGDIITEDFTRTWNEVARRGMLGIAVGGPVDLWLHPAELAYLDFPPSLMDAVNCNGAMWGINAQHYDSMMKISRPLFDCARTRACIAPLGSSRENHRQDQAALSALIHLHGYKCDYHPPITMGGDAPGDGSKFCEDGREC